MIGFGASSKDVQVNQNQNWWGPGWGWGWGWWGPGWGGNQTSVQTRTVGNLTSMYDARTQNWFGWVKEEEPYLKNAKRTERIHAFVTQLIQNSLIRRINFLRLKLTILLNFPPAVGKWLSAAAALDVLS